MFRLGAINSVLQDILLLQLNSVLIHLLQDALGHPDVTEERVAAVLGEILADDDAQHLEAVGVWRHGVRGDDPAASALSYQIFSSAFSYLCSTTKRGVLNNLADLDDRMRKSRQDSRLLFPSRAMHGR